MLLIPCGLNLVIVQFSEVAKSLFKLLLCLFELFALVEELAECFALFDTFNAG